MMKKLKTVESQPILLDAEQLANRYGVAKKTIRKWGQEGKLPFFKISRRCVRYPIAECDEIILGKLIAKQEVTA
jgi:predicted site-specific integrase-resolvase